MLIYSLGLAGVDSRSAVPSHGLTSHSYEGSVASYLDLERLSKAPSSERGPYRKWKSIQGPQRNLILLLVINSFQFLFLPIYFDFLNFLSSLYFPIFSDFFRRFEDSGQEGLSRISMKSRSQH